jgi:hypothetical protein
MPRPKIPKIAWAYASYAASTAALISTILYSLFSNQKDQVSVWFAVSGLVLLTAVLFSVTISGTGIERLRLEFEFRTQLRKSKNLKKSVLTSDGDLGEIWEKLESLRNRSDFDKYADDYNRLVLRHAKLRRRQVLMIEYITYQEKNIMDTMAALRRADVAEVRRLVKELNEKFDEYSQARDG